MRGNRLPALLFALCAAAAACSAPSPGGAGLAVGEQELKAQEATAQQAQCDPGSEHWIAKGPPRRGGIVSIEGGSPHLDPTAAGGSAAYHQNIYSYLVRPRSCYFSDMTVMLPSLAASWEIAPDGLVWTLHLQREARWHNRPPVNGRAFTSADVAWTIEYLKQESDLRSYWIPVTHEEPDPYTVVLRFKEPDADFLGKLGDERSVILPHEVKEQLGDFKGTAIGTGAFMLKEFKPNQVTVVERNPNYYFTGADGQSLPYVDEVQGIFFADSATQVAALRSGTLDQTMGATIKKFQQDSLKQAGVKANYSADPAATVNGVWLNPGVPPWNDARVRRAISLAIDREDLIASDGGGAVFQGFVPQSLPSYAWPLDTVKARFKADPEQAKRLLAEAGFVQGPAPFTMKTGTTYGEHLEVIQRQLEQIGIRTKLDIGPGAASGPIIRSFEYDLAYGPPGGGRFPDYWVGDLVRTGAGRNVSRYGNPQLDQLIDAQKREMDPARRKQLIDRIQDMMYDQMPYIPTVSRVYYGFQSCRLKNMRSNNADSKNNWGLEHAWIDPEAC